MAMGFPYWSYYPQWIDREQFYRKKCHSWILLSWYIKLVVVTTGFGNQFTTECHQLVRNGLRPPCQLLFFLFFLCMTLPGIVLMGKGRVSWIFLHELAWGDYCKCMHSMAWKLAMSCNVKTHATHAQPVDFTRPHAIENTTLVVRGKRPEITQQSTLLEPTGSYTGLGLRLPKLPSRSTVLVYFT